MRVKRFLQLTIGRILNAPAIPDDKTVGYSLVRSERVDTVLGEPTRITPPFYLHHVSLGSYSYIARNCSITNCEIGKFCSIGPNFCCGLGIHPTNGISTSPMFYSTAKQNGISLCEKDKIQESKHTVIGNDVFIGANVTVLDGVNIGDGAVIGACAVVVSDIPPYAIAVGVPAVVKRFRFEPEIIERLLDCKWWDKDEKELELLEKNFFDPLVFLDKVAK